MSSKTDQKIRAAILAYIEEENIGIAIFEKCIEAFKPFEGKPISKRLATALQNLLPDYTVTYCTDYGMYHVKVYGQNVPYNRELSFLVGYNSDAIYREGKDKTDLYAEDRGFRTFSACYGWAARERNKKNQALLEDNKTIAKLVGIFDRLIQAQKDFEEYNSHGSYNMPAWYSMLEAVGLKEKK